MSSCERYNTKGKNQSFYINPDLKPNTFICINKHTVDSHDFGISVMSKKWPLFRFLPLCGVSHFQEFSVLKPISPWKRRKTTSSAIFCASGARELRMRKL